MMPVHGALDEQRTVRSKLPEATLTKVGSHLHFQILAILGNKSNFVEMSIE